jgi:di/tricarboxylate transporter
VSPAALSLLALLVAIVVSCVSRANVGVLAMAFAWLIGTYSAGWRADQVMAGFPVSLFLTLVGVTLLFALAEANHTLEHLAGRLVRLAGHRRAAVPPILFVVAGLLSSVGPGAVSTTALLAPLAMAIGTQFGVPAVVVALMVANGANAGNLSPISAVGVIANSRMAEAGIGPFPAKVWFANFAAHLLVAVAALYLFRREPVAVRAAPDPAAAAPSSMTRAQWLTTAVIGLWVVGVVGFQLSVGLAAFGAAAFLVALGAADESSAFKRVPWAVIVMVSGVSVLIGVLEKTGGMDLFAALLAAIANDATINGTIALVTGLISSWSSTSGVVLPAFLPTVPALVERLGGGDPLAVSLSINVGSSMVDVSPLSTIGALVVAAVADPAAARRLFRQLMIWGLSMAVVAAVLCQVFAGLIARW